MNWYRYPSTAMIFDFQSFSTVSGRTHYTTEAAFSFDFRSFSHAPAVAGCEEENDEENNR